MEPMSCLIRRGLRPSAWKHGKWPPIESASRRKWLSIQAVHSIEPNTTINGSYLPPAATPSSVTSPDAKFEVLGAPYSLLSVSLSASQDLFTRRGTLVGLTGKAGNISSASPVNALVSVRSPMTSFAVVQLDGTVDWMITQRDALLAWTGYALIVKPVLNRELSFVHWGSSKVTGRGLLAIVGRGQVYSITLKAGEQYVAHPSNVVAYTIRSHWPRPFRFKSTSLRLQIPKIPVNSLLIRSKFLRNLADSDTWKATMRVFHAVRTWARRTIWGDRLFLKFEGPATILIQSRASRINESLSTREVNEIADTQPGVTREAIDMVQGRLEEESPPPVKEDEMRVVGQNFAAIRRDGKVEFKKAGDAD
ncbi:Altered inheritance of mitochondria protein 24, mitochondrial [Emydomyces testavorans]|uniref:Altered inheritance of mitochondria protein 24, mitochondrial n=1 Tax=Emydomyces testavorans TaxID=2070801 RepID=A0AAF0DKU1_9EURO|nr:Altered inheritance of mitochondria protein 24, mitochondrial [Emydomyces testavorans]